MKTLLKNFTIVTMNENLDVLKDAHLIVEDGKITEVAAGAATGDFDEVIDGQNKQVLMRYMVYGGSIAGAGLFAGLILPSLLRVRRKRNDKWF